MIAPPAAVVVEEPRVVALVGPRAADALNEHIPVGCGGGRGHFFKILGLRARDLLLLVAAEPKRVAGLGPPDTLADSCSRLLAIPIRVGALRQRGGEVQVDGMGAWITVPFRRETEGGGSEKAPAFPGTAGAGVGAGGRRGVDAIALPT